MVVPLCSFEPLLLKAPLYDLVLRLFMWAFNVVGLRSFFEYSGDDICPESTGASIGNEEEEEEEQYLDDPKFQLLSTLLIQEFLPSALYDDTEAAEGVPCVVCLCEFEAGDEVRRLSNCRHVFHRCCLDGWIEHEHTTCPLCRASLVSSDEMEALMMAREDGDGDSYYYYDRVWAAAGIPDSYDSEGGDHPATPISSSSPVTESLVPFIFPY